MTSGELTSVQQANVEVVERLNAVYAEGGFEGMTERYDEFFHPDYVLIREGLGEERFEGREGILAYGDDLAATTREYEIRATETRPVGEQHVLNIGEVELVGVESGAPTKSDWGVVYRAVDGRVKSAQVYFSLDEAERAAADAAA